MIPEDMFSSQEKINEQKNILDNAVELMKEIIEAIEENTDKNGMVKIQYIADELEQLKKFVK